jgi:1-acyl-sn-glycerol-3-phosphate acyltransferase
MPAETSIPQKPRSDVIQPDLIRLAELTWRRRFFRRFIHWLSKFLVIVWTRPKLIGLENIPDEGPVLFVSNHLGDADLIMGFAYGPSNVEPIAKIELIKMPVLGWLLHTYGVIWIHRGQADRRALRVVLEAFKQDRMVGIAPEGRESLTGALEEGTGGAAYFALKGDVPIIPVTFTGTENKYIFRNMVKFRRSDVSMTVGKPFRILPHEDRREAINAGTKQIMVTLAQQLPPSYRGYYQNEA